MQIRIARLVNRMLIAYFFVMVILGGLLVWISRTHREIFWYCFAGFAFVGVVLFLAFKWFENSWDKRVITKMALAGRVALMEIVSGEKIAPVRDSSFRSYWIWRFRGILYDGGHVRHEKTFTEKMAASFDSVPQGFVYVTWEPAKPSQIFIIPTALIAGIPQLRPVAESYENDKNIKLRYLEAIYRGGIEIRTFREALGADREAAT